ncbi:MAG: nucleotidyltransferase domain-containing protein [Desulfovibrio sp.]|jgi:hypothetical protein|nr:nucleotidyltransferase domain-containing protein [Desulfovibrio sp.]
MREPRHIDRPALVEQARALCRAHDASLLFLTLFGATLYGTESPGKSDIDARGIFLPSLESLALDKVPRSLRFSTGDGTRRNTAGDVDIDLWSVQRWLLKLLPAGDIGAMDLLFSPSNADCTLYRRQALDAVFANPLRLVNTHKNRAYAEYSLGQVKKYGIRGSRVGALKAVRDWLRQRRPDPTGRLADCLEAIVAACGDNRYCSLKNIQGEKALQLGGKLHMGAIRVSELICRVEADMKRYGGRADAAERSEGLDLKAFSHALRALEQMEELLRTGKVVFPLQGREDLAAVKAGKYSWKELESRILHHLEAVEAMQEHAPFVGEHDAAFAEECVLACYGLTPAVQNLHSSSIGDIFSKACDCAIPKET